jgi:hypothetical protein
MAIASMTDYLASLKQRKTLIRTASRTAVAMMYTSIFDLAGNPGAGTLAIGNTANGLVPTDATAGYPLINAYGGSALGYLSRVVFYNTVPCWIDVYDRVFACGAYAFNAATTLTAQPSYAARIPNTDYTGCQLWLEQVTAGTLAQSVAVTYLDQGGGAGTTGTFPTAVNIVGRCWQLPLAAGDTGVSQVVSVTGSVASAGTFNINVLRPLWSGRVSVANGGDVHDFLRTGMPQLLDTAAIYVLISPDSTATGLSELSLDISSN